MSLICKPFVFVRHGETPLNRDKLIGGRTDVPLTEEGEKQALAAGPLLRSRTWSGVGVSSLQRARHTLELALPGVQYETLDGLRERDWGLLENHPIAELPPYESTPPWGESWEAFTTRVTDALNSLLEKYEMPLIVAHSGVFRVIRYYASGTPYGDRVGNVVPMWISPGKTEEEWQIVPLSEASLAPWRQ
jgi:probable phosphoglycerate mutase